MLQRIGKGNVHAFDKVKFGVEGIAMKAVWILALLWSLPWKGVALWKAARNNQKGWYVTMLIMQTLGVLEIIYIVFFQRTRNTGLRFYNTP